MNRRQIILLLFLCIVNIAFGQKVKSYITENTQKEKLQQFLSLTDSIRIAGNNPGMAMAIIYNNELLYKNGLGYRNRDTKLPVSNKTLFELGSLVKGLTGTIAAQLVDEGKMNWDDKAIQHIPELKFKDPYVTENATIKDLLTHYTGLYQHYNLLFGPKLTTGKLLEILPYMDFGGSFREKFLYNNFTYALGGIAIERITGQSFESLLQQRIFDKLEMTNSYPVAYKESNKTNFATGYLYNGTTPATQSAPPNNTFSAAGTTAASDIDDMTIWLKTLINKGTFQDKRILSEKQFNYVTDPLVVRNAKNNRFYGIGWDIDTTEEYHTISHDGVTDGHRSRILFIPELGFGIVVLTNQNSVLPSILTRVAENIFVYDRDIDSSGFLAYLKNGIATEKEYKEFELFSIKDEQVLANMNGISGRYYHPAYGELKLIFNQDDQILFEYYDFKGSLLYDKEKGLTACVNHYLGKEKYPIHVLHSNDNEIYGVEVAIPNTDPLQFIKQRKE